MVTKKEIGEVTSLKKSALNIRNGDEVIKHFIDKVNPKVILEIGTYKGITSLYMSQFCEKLYTIDLLYGKLEDECKPNHLVRYKLWEKFDVNRKIWFQPVKCNRSKERVIKKMDFQFAFIDGDHTFEGAKYDFDLVKRCGNVLFHDYDDSGREKRNGVYNFVNTLPRHQITVKDIFAFWSNK